MSETERKTEENESSSDEEPPPGELDKPIVILYNKRAKKVCHHFLKGTILSSLWSFNLWFLGSTHMQMICIN